MDVLIQEREERQATAPGRLCVSAKLMLAVREAIKNAPKSRETLADELTMLTGQPISVHQVNNWTAESHPHRLPAEIIPALVASTGSIEPLRVLAEAAGVFTLPGPDALRAEVQKLREEEHKIATERKRRELFLREMEG
ncbi:MAG: hypothetical protein VKK97_04075 [Synechococcaceae cyanobacterium]|nr:hypothetical protein [Synechococcaceae cyanobacterium]